MEILKESQEWMEMGMWFRDHLLVLIRFDSVALICMRPCFDGSMNSSPSLRISCRFACFHIRVSDIYVGLIIYYDVMTLS